MKPINILIISFFITVSFSTCNEDKISIDALDELDYELYSFILDEAYWLNSIEYTVKSETTTWNYDNLAIDDFAFQSLIDSFPGIDISVFSDYISKNETILYLDSIKFKEAGKVVTLVSQEEYIDKDKGWFSWTKFYEEYPNSNGLMIFRRIGYNSDKSQAIVEFEHIDSHGIGYLIYLVRNNNNEWEIIKWGQRWIS